MTIRVKYRKGVFEPLSPIQKIDFEEGAELEIEILRRSNKEKLKRIIGLLADQSPADMKKFEESA